MWNKLVAWLLALVTAIFNNFGIYTQPDKTYKQEATYTIQEDAVDYGELYTWHKGTYTGTDSCNVNNIKSESVSRGKNNIAFPVAGAEFNPDAQLTLSDESLIIAPEDCEVTSSPSNKSNEIIVQNDLPGNLGFKMVVKNPKRWFCCVDAKPDASGRFRHSQESHNVDLKQGDVIAVASSDTELLFYRGEGSSGGPKKCDLSTFLKRLDEEGNEEVNLSGDAEQVLTNTEYIKDAINQKIEIPANKVFSGPSGWHQDSTGWRYGRGGKAGQDYPANQYIIYEGQFYYFNSAGYMVTGWGDDGYYYTESQRSEGFKQGALAYETIVPAEGGGDNYVYVDDTGKVANEKGTSLMAVGAITYAYDSGSNYYKKSSEVGGGNSSGSDNNGQGSSINTQRVTLTAEQYQTILNGDPIETSYDGWCKYNGKWLWLDAGLPATYDMDKGWESDSGTMYRLLINGQAYFFDMNTHLMLEGNALGEAPAYVHKGDYWAVLNEDLGVFKGTWLVSNGGEWMYARQTDGFLCCKSRQPDMHPEGAFIVPEGSNNYYVFKEDCTLDTTTPEVYITSGEPDIKLVLNPDKPDGPRIAQVLD